MGLSTQADNENYERLSWKVAGRAWGIACVERNEAGFWWGFACKLPGDGRDVFRDVFAWRQRASREVKEVKKRRRKKAITSDLGNVCLKKRRLDFFYYYLPDFFFEIHHNVLGNIQILKMMSILLMKLIN